MERLRPRALAVLAGACLAGSVPPWGWWPLAFLGIALLDQLIADQTRLERFRRTWLVAAAWLYPGMLWMWDLTAPGYLVAGAFYATYFGLAAAATPPGPLRRLVFPGAFALAEMARWYWPFGGVPLANLALSQANAPLGITARLGGPLLVVVLVVVVGQSLSAVYDARQAKAVPGPGPQERSPEHADPELDPKHIPEPSDRARARTQQRSAERSRPVHSTGRAAVIGVAIAAAAVVVGNLHPRSTVIGEFTIAAVQGGGPQRTLASSVQQPVVLARHTEASGQIREPVDLVLWPENVVNPGKLLGEDDAFATVAAVARDVDAPVLAGWFLPVSETENANYQSVITPDGVETDRYDKIRIVPFGEFVPFRSLIETLAPSAPLPRRDVQIGTVEPVLDTDVGPIGVSISWEGFFERRARHSVREGAEILTNPTNGASYWLTQVQTQQVASNQLRAIENDRWVVQVAPTGLSAIVSPNGDVLQRSDVSERTTLVDTVERRQGRTLSSLVGPWPVVAYALAAFGFAAASRRVNSAEPPTGS